MNSSAISAVAFDGGIGQGRSAPSSLSHFADVIPESTSLDAAKVAVPPPGRLVNSDFARLSSFMEDGFANGFTTRFKGELFSVLQASARGESNLGEVIALSNVTSEAISVGKTISTIARDFVTGIKDLVLKA
jgi:hypothetical protein